MLTGQQKGVLIAIEGIDGAGKTTHAARLMDGLNGRDVQAVVFSEPGKSPYGDKIRELSRNGRVASPEEEMELFLKDREIDVRDNIVPALARGKFVIMDRYYFSSMAYQGALGLDPATIRRRNEVFSPRPDLTMILDIDPRKSIKRIYARKDKPNHFEREDYLRSVRELFHTFLSSDVTLVDSDRPIEAVHATVWESVLALIPPAQRPRRGEPLRENVRRRA